MSSSPDSARLATRELSQREPQERRHRLRVRACALVTVIVALLLPASAVSATTLSGTLIEVHGHRADGNVVERSYALDVGERDEPLTDRQPRSLIGQRVRVTDRDAAPGLQGRVRAADGQRVAAARGAGARSLLVILLTMPDAPQASASPDAARTAVFTGPRSADALYEQQSAGATRFVGRIRADGDIAGPLQISVAAGECDVYAIADSADAAVRSSGWAPDAYDHVLYALPSDAGCGWAGLGQLPGRRTWVRGALSTGVVAHELGHNLGAHHASAYRCTTDGGVPVTLARSCDTSEYGDPFDVMGFNAVPMSSWHRAQVGQLPATQQLSLRHSQTVTLVSSDAPADTGPRLLLVPRKDPGVAVTSWISLELRSSRQPFDVWAPGHPATTGISVRLVPDVTSFSQTQLLDARPSTDTSVDAPLQPGESLRDEAHGITITAGTIAGETATVAVTMPTLVDDVVPSSPHNLAWTGDTNAVNVTWSAGTDDDAVDHYDVERDGVIVGSTRGLSFSDSRVAQLTTTTYRVIAVDSSGNGGASWPLRVGLRDATPPSTVPGLSATSRDGRVALSWSAAQDNRAVRGYRVLRDGVALTQVPGTTYSDGPGAGRHRYEVRAVDAAGNSGAGAAIDVVMSRRPRSVLERWSWHGRVLAMRFRASGATSMRAYSAGRRVARARGPRLTVRLRVAHHARRRTVSVVASSAAGTRTSTWTLEKKTHRASNITARGRRSQE